jgi:hypothetical protein
VRPTHPTRQYALDSASNCRKFRNKSGYALSADGLHVDQDVLFLEAVEADGEVRLVGGHARGLLDLTGGKFRNPDRTALAADRVRVDSTLYWEPTEVIGEVSYAFGSVGVWSDDDAGLGFPMMYG